MRAAYDILVAMQKLRLLPADEVIHNLESYLVFNDSFKHPKWVFYVYLLKLLLLLVSSLLVSLMNPFYDLFLIVRFISRFISNQYYLSFCWMCDDMIH